MNATENTLPLWREPERQAWRPPEELTISEWAEKYRILTSPAEEKGPLRFRRTPYIVPIIDSVLDPDVETVVFCKSAQIAGTEGMLSILGYFSHQEPCPIMLVLADEDTAKYMSRERVQMMFRNSQELSGLILEDRMNLEEITLGNGAYIAFSWASSVARIGSRPIRIVICDEVDKPGYYVLTNEGSPIELAAQRLESYYNGKLLILSTPTIETGNISTQLESCDVIYDWHVPCPYCGQLQPMRWSLKFSTGFPDGLYRAEDGTMHQIGGVVWEGGRNATAAQIAAAGYRCGECGEIWTTVEKNRAVELGRMVPRTEILTPPRKVGFHVNRLYSLLGKSGDIPRMVRQWIKSLNDPKKLQAFINSALADVFKHTVVSSSESSILAARCDLEPETIPPEAVALTAGVDCQKYGFWVLVRAWARDYTSWLVHYGYLGIWADVEEFLFDSRFPIAGSDQTMGIWRCGLDIGGGRGELDMSMTEEAYWFVMNNRFRGVRLWACKGASRPLAGKLQVGKPLEKTPSGKALPGGLQIISIDTEKMKDLVHYRLDQAAENSLQAAYLHKETDDQYVKQILAEEKRRNKRGVEEWVKIKADNHLLDCEVLAHAAADKEWPGGGVHILAAQTESIANRSRRVRSRGING